MKNHNTLGDICSDKRSSHTTYCSHYQELGCEETCWYAQHRRELRERVRQQLNGGSKNDNKKM